MAITIRLTDEQEELLAVAMELTEQSTKSKTVLYLIENAERLLKDKKELISIKEEVDGLFYTLDKLKKHKIEF